MASKQQERTTPFGAKWPLWLVVSSYGNPVGYLVTRAGGDGFPEPVAKVTWVGRDAVQLADAIARDNTLAGREELAAVLRTSPWVLPMGLELSAVLDLRDMSMERWAGITAGCSLLPVDHQGGLATFDGTSFGAKLVRGKDGRWNWQDAHSGKRFCLTSQNKNGTSELTDHTLKLGGTGRGRLATPTAA